LLGALGLPATAFLVRPRNTPEAAVLAGRRLIHQEPCLAVLVALVVAALVETLLSVLHPLEQTELLTKGAVGVAAAWIPFRLKLAAQAQAVAQVL